MAVLNYFYCYILESVQRMLHIESEIKQSVTAEFQLVENSLSQAVYLERLSGGDKLECFLNLK